MSLLRRTRTEMAGAWRSLRYDLGRTPVPPPGDGPDVTSTGMGTWGLPGLVDQAAPAPEARRPRRAVAATAVGTLAVIGGAAAYLALVHGLGSLAAQSPAAADALTPRAAVTTAAKMGSSATRGRVAKTKPARPRITGSPTAVRVPAPPVAQPAAPPAALGAKEPAEPPRATTSPVRTAGPKRTVKPTSPECHCQPPVPTPTEPPSPTPSASGPASPSPSADESADPSDSPSPSRSWDGRRPRWHH